MYGLCTRGGGGGRDGGCRPTLPPAAPCWSVYRPFSQNGTLQRGAGSPRPRVNVPHAGASHVNALSVALGRQLGLPGVAVGATSLPERVHSDRSPTRIEQWQHEIAAKESAPSLHLMAQQGHLRCKTLLRISLHMHKIKLLSILQTMTSLRFLRLIYKIFGTRATLCLNS